MSTSPTIDWQTSGVKRWCAVLDKLPHSAVEQTWAFGEATRLHARRQIMRGIITYKGADIGLIQAQGRSFGPLTFWLLPRGPHFVEDVPEDVKAVVYRLIRQKLNIRQGDFLLWLPELTDTPESLKTMRTLRMRRLVTGYHSGWLDLTPTPKILRGNFRKNWLGALKLAEKSKLKVRLSHTGKTLTWLLEQADKHRKTGGYQGTSGAFAHMLAGLTPNRGDILTLTAEQDGKPIAGMLFIIHGKCATYYMGWNGEDGRPLNAHHLLLWHGIQELHNRHITALDLGGIWTDSNTGVARFKLGVTPKVYSLAGIFA